MLIFLNIFVLLTLPVFVFLALCIWKRACSLETGRSIPDRFAWTSFALGIGLMLNMFLYVAASEHRVYRTWETIRLHTRLFIAFAAVALTGPLIVSVLQATMPRRTKAPSKKPLVDDLS